MAAHYCAVYVKEYRFDNNSPSRWFFRSLGFTGLKETVTGRGIIYKQIFDVPFRAGTVSMML